jgi:hypothetical protein
MFKFNLEQSIMEWRQGMLAKGIGSPIPLEELESHLREEIEQRVQFGLKEPEAFEITVQQFGRAQVIKTEFEKIGETTRKERMKKIIIIGNGIGGVLIGLALIMPALAQYQNAGAMTNESVAALFIGSFLMLGGGCTAFCGFTLRKT